MGIFTLPIGISSNLLLIGFIILLLMLLVAIYLTSKNPKSSFQWTDLIMDPISNKGSLTRVLQLTGGLTATYIVIQEASKSILSAEMFGIYLAALGVSEGFSKWVQLKYPVKANDSK